MHNGRRKQSVQTKKIIAGVHEKKIEKLFGVLEKIHKTWICVKSTTKQIYIVRIRSLEENNNL